MNEDLKDIEEQLETIFSQDRKCKNCGKPIPDYLDFCSKNCLDIYKINHDPELWFNHPTKSFVAYYVDNHTLVVSSKNRKITVIISENDEKAKK